MKYWKTADGKKLRIVDMETSHIENCIRMLNGNINDAQNFMSAEENRMFALSLDEAEDYIVNASKVVAEFEKVLVERSTQPKKR